MSRGRTSSPDPDLPKFVRYKEKNIFLDGTIVTVPGNNNRCFFEAIAKEVGQPVDTVISNYKSHLMQSDRARYFYDKDLHHHFPELHVGRKVRKSHKMYSGNLKSDLLRSGIFQNQIY